jgi:hypothetical protein
LNARSAHGRPHALCYAAPAAGRARRQRRRGDHCARPADADAADAAADASTAANPAAAAASRSRRTGNLHPGRHVFGTQLLQQFPCRFVWISHLFNTTSGTGL